MGHWPAHNVAARRSSGLNGLLLYNISLLIVYLIGHSTLRKMEDRAARLRRITAMAEATFGSCEKARLWMRRPSRPLGGVAPIALLDSDEGAEAVENLLGRIDHGLSA
jgi:hypothetical protein